MELTWTSIIGLCMTGLMGVLWWDIRGIRKATEQDVDELKQEIKGADYLTEAKHDLLCTNATLRFEKIVSGMRDEIIKEIKNNNRKEK
jgi:hypothetical protein